MLLALHGSLSTAFHGRATHIVDLESIDALATAPCPTVRYAAMVLKRAGDRVLIFKQNRNLMRAASADMVRFDAVDGIDHAAALRTWRELGVRYVSQHPKQLRSFGALACTLSHLRLLRWQVQNRVPLVVALEDDVQIVNATRFALLACHGAKYMHREPYRLIRYGYNSEFHLYSIEGAKRVLRSYCRNGIVDNADDALERYERPPRAKAATSSSSAGAGGAPPLRAAYLPVNALGIWRVFGGGHSRGYIARTGHFLNSTQIRLESAAWPDGKGTARAWCSDGTLQ